MNDNEIKAAIAECSMNHTIAMKRGDEKNQAVLEAAMLSLQWKLQRREERRKGKKEQQ